MSGRSAFAETPLLKHTKSGKTGHRLVGTLYHTCIGFKDRFPPCLPKAFRKARDRDGEGAGRHGPDRRCMAGSMRNRAARDERTGCGPADAQNGKGGRQAKARCAERENHLRQASASRFDFCRIQSAANYVIPDHLFTFTTMQNRRHLEAKAENTQNGRIAPSGHTVRITIAPASTTSITQGKARICHGLPSSAHQHRDKRRAGRGKHGRAEHAFAWARPPSGLDAGRILRLHDAGRRAERILSLSVRRRNGVFPGNPPVRRFDRPEAPAPLHGKTGHLPCGRVCSLGLGPARLERIRPCRDAGHRPAVKRDAWHRRGSDHVVLGYSVLAP